MDKSPEAFRTISEVAEQLDTPAHVLRFWESRFPQIRPVKRAGGRRYYRPSDVALLTGIKRLLHDDGLTIRGVQKILREQGVRHVAGLGGDDGQRVDAYVDIIDETPVAAEPAMPQAAAVQPLATVAAAPEDRAAAPVLPEPPDLWPDADLTPPEVVTAFDLDLVVAVAPGAAPQEPATDTDDDQFLALLAEVSRTEDQDRVPAPRVPVADAGGTDDPDAPSLPEAGKTMPAAPVRADDTWRSIPLAHGEDMPLSSRVRAMPRGALVPRRDEVSAWVVRARDLTRRMGEPARTGRD